MVPLLSWKVRRDEKNQAFHSRPPTQHTVPCTFPPAEYHFLSRRASASISGAQDAHRNLKGFYRIQYSSPIVPRPSFLHRMDVSLYSKWPCGASASADRRLPNQLAGIVFHSPFHVRTIPFSHSASGLERMCRRPCAEPHGYAATLVETHAKTTAYICPVVHASLRVLTGVSQR